MARVADYSIVADGWVVEATQDTRTFEVPSNVDAGTRSVLSFMIQAWHSDDMSLSVRLNGTKVWDWNYTGDSRHVQFFQEVVEAGLVKPGTNTLSFESSSGDYRYVALSDIVVLWQANI
jgi:hypothetical protein